MKKGFPSILSAQFFSSLADNALLIATIALLQQMLSPDWQAPLLKFFFTVSYVALAIYVGVVADRFLKGRVMLFSNSIKIFGCLLLMFGADPLMAYGVVGIGAAAYSPAKYGIITELLDPEDLVMANGWLEGLTVGSIILGTLVGGVLVNEQVVLWLEALIFTPLELVPEYQAIVSISCVLLIYVVAALCNLLIPDTGVRYPKQSYNPIPLIKAFSKCVATLWKDKLGQISLAVTTLFWGAGATLQFIVLDWAAAYLDFKLDKASMLQGVVAIGIILGSVVASKYMSLRQAAKTIPFGIFMSFIVMSITFVDQLSTNVIFEIGFFAFSPRLLVSLCLLIAIGFCAGFFVVPMNALLQHRGFVLLSAGASISVQNFNENLSILVMLSVYSFLIWSEIPVGSVVMLFGCFVAIIMSLIYLLYKYNAKHFDLDELIDQRATHQRIS